MKKILALLLMSVILVSFAGCKKNYYNPNIEDSAAIETKITLEHSSISLEVGDVIKLDYKMSPEKDKDAKVKWSSSDNAIASIGQNGEVIAKKEGDAVITVKTDDEKATASCNVKVVPLRKAIISGAVPGASKAGAVYNINVSFENCSQPSVKIVSDCGGGSISSVNGTTKLGSSPTQVKVTGDTKISFAISDNKEINSIRLLCFDNGQIIDSKEYSVNLIRE